MDKLLLTPTEAAHALGIGRSKVYELMQTGQLPSVHIGACRRVPAEALHNFLRTLGTTARPWNTGPAGLPPAHKGEPQQRADQPPPAIGRLDAANS